MPYNMLFSSEEQVKLATELQKDVTELQLNHPLPLPLNEYKDRLVRNEGMPDIIAMEAFSGVHVKKAEEVKPIELESINDVADVLYDMAHKQNYPMLQKSAEDILKSLANKGYPGAQFGYANLMEERGDFAKAYVYMGKLAANDLVPENTQEVASARMRDLRTRKSVTEYTKKLETAWALNKVDVPAMQAMRDMKIPDITQQPREGERNDINEYANQLANIAHMTDYPEIAQQAEKDLTQLAEKGYPVAQCQMAYLKKEQGRPSLADVYFNMYQDNLFVTSEDKKEVASSFGDVVPDKAHKRPVIELSREFEPDGRNVTPPHVPEPREPHRDPHTHREMRDVTPPHVPEPRESHREMPYVRDKGNKR